MVIRYAVIVCLGFFATLSYGQQSFTYNYQGPFAQAPQAAPYGGEYDDKAYEAYRYGKLKEYEAFRESNENTIAQLAAQNAQANQNGLSVDQAMAQARKMFAQTRPPVSPDIVDQTQRAKLNPLPPNQTAEAMQGYLNPVWNSVRQQNVLKAADDLANLDALATPLPNSSSALLSAPEASYLRKELALSDITDDQGLLKAPYATIPKTPLATDRNTEYGVTIRSGFNKLLASQSVIGEGCANNPSLQSLCAQSGQRLTSALQGMQMMDRVGYLQGGFNDPLSQDVFNRVLDGVNFTAGIARGIKDGSLALADGLHKLVTTNPLETAAAIGQAISHMPQVIDAVTKWAHATADQFANGDAATRGQMIGRAAFEIGVLLFPVGDAAEALKLQTMTDIVRYEAIAEVLQRAPNLAALLPPLQVRAALISEQLGIAPAVALQYATKYLDAAGDGTLACSFVVTFREAPERLAMLSDTLARVGDSVSEGAKSYAVREMIFEERVVGETLYTPDGLSKVMETYDHYSLAFQTAPVAQVPAEGITATRGISKSSVDFRYETPIVHTQDDVMKTTLFNEYSNHRYSGITEGAIYTTVGEDAKATILLETGKSESELVFETATFHPDKVLDLRDPSVLEHFGLNEKDLVRSLSDDPNVYQNTQILGHLARENGYDAFLAYSAAAKNKLVTNLIIFK